MTKTELKKQQVKAVIELLINQFNAQVEDADGGRMDITIGDLQGQFSRRDFEVAMFDSISFYNPSDFPAEIVDRHERAVELEDELNKAIANLLK